ncbi:hypothetical protein [Nocardia sp. CY41]|uniref:hypothetical protein n=1 Tax=Nocardia sp. CY41 TaxID=2608686 RepID=UPI00135CE056|nr:hypothetical protein [Nocardia sp. CY41]
MYPSRAGAVTHRISPTLAIFVVGYALCAVVGVATTAILGAVIGAMVGTVAPDVIRRCCPDNRRLTSWHISLPYSFFCVALSV